MSRTLYRRIERLLIVLILLGMLGMFQPLSLDLYRYGFLTLLLSTLLFIVFSHLSPAPQRDEQSAPLGVEHALERPAE